MLLRRWGLEGAHLGTPLMNLAAFVVVTLALTIAVAALSWYLIERPAMTLRRLAMDRAEPRDGESRVIAAGALARSPAAEAPP